MAIGAYGFHKRPSLLSVCSRLVMLFQMDRSCRVSFGRPRLLFQSGVQRNVALGNVPRDNRQMCPRHLHCLPVICVTMYMVSLLPSTSLCVIRLGHSTLNILRKHMFWNVSSTRASGAVGFQHSEPYNRNLTTLLLYSLNLVFSVNCYAFQMVSSSNITFL